MVSARLRPDVYAQGIEAGNTLILSKAISLSESTLFSDHELLAEVWALLPNKLYDSHNHGRTIAITGAPGVGKSTFIEAFGMMMVDNTHQKLAVLAIDPSSSRSHGSILGDKTRMQILSMHAGVYIRPSATAGAWGGVAAHTRQAIALCRAAGFENIIVETVGVGQSETLAAQMSDMFLLLLSAGSGDELQGIKRGIMEMADLLIINKADKPADTKSKMTMLEYQNALSLMQPPPHGQKPQVMLCSAINQYGLSDIYQQINIFFEQINQSGYLLKNRQSQAKKWIEDQIKNYLWQDLYQTKQISSVVQNAIDRLSHSNLPESLILFDAIKELKMNR